MQVLPAAQLPSSTAAAQPAQRSRQLSPAGMVQEHGSSRATACSPAGAGCVSGVHGRWAGGPTKGSGLCRPGVMGQRGAWHVPFSVGTCREGSGSAAGPGAPGCSRHLKV